MILSSMSPNSSEFLTPRTTATRTRLPPGWLLVDTGFHALAMPDVGGTGAAQLFINIVNQIAETIAFASRDPTFILLPHAGTLYKACIFNSLAGDVTIMMLMVTAPVFLQSTRLFATSS